MQIWHAIILSIVEGVTEFLPVSSTGHLIATSALLGLPATEFQKSFEIFIQLGSIGAAIVLYAKRILSNRTLFLKLCTAFVPTGIAGLLLYKLIKHYLLGNLHVVAWSLLLGGIAIMAFESWYKRAKPRGTAAVTYPQAAAIGTFQILSMIPGVSRSAATIIGGMFSGLTREAAIEFSFMLAIPTMLAASGLDLVKTPLHFSGNEWMLLAVGFVGAFITALLVIRAFLQLIRTNIFWWFGAYRVVFALVIFYFIK